MPDPGWCQKNPTVTSIVIQKYFLYNTLKMHFNKGRVDSRPLCKKVKGKKEASEKEMHLTEEGILERHIIIWTQLL